MLTAEVFLRMASIAGGTEQTLASIRFQKPEVVLETRLR
jgi:hypothetical protein